MGSMSGLQASTCPSLMSVGPKSSNMSRRRSGALTRCSRDGGFLNVTMRLPNDTKRCRPICSTRWSNPWRDATAMIRPIRGMSRKCLLLKPTRDIGVARPELCPAFPFASFKLREPCGDVLELFLDFLDIVAGRDIEFLKGGRYGVLDLVVHVLRAFFRLGDP